MVQRIPVDVISLCSAAGEIRPLRLRVEDARRELRRADVAQILRVKQVPFVGVEAYQFLCRVSWEGKQGVLELEYDIRSHQWVLLGESTGNPRMTVV